jgi:hypothetical protein
MSAYHTDFGEWAGRTAALLKAWKVRRIGLAKAVRAPCGIDKTDAKILDSERIKRQRGLSPPCVSTTRRRPLHPVELHSRTRSINCSASQGSSS